MMKEMSWSFCPQCGKVMSKGVSVCPNCGYSSKGKADEGLGNDRTVKSVPMAVPQRNIPNTGNSFSVWCLLSILSAICGAVSFAKGFNRLTVYENNSWGDSVNAYVGGDAYNYIINGTHTTAFFVLTTMFVLAAIGFLIVHYLSQDKG